MATFQNLPTELVLHILSHLNVRPPSKERLHDEPIPQMFYSNTQPLKSVTLTCHYLRNISIKSLFRRVNIKLGQPLSQFYKLMGTYSIEKNGVDSVLIQDQYAYGGPSNEIMPYSILYMVSSILQNMDPKDVTLACAPETLAKIMSVSIQTQSSWAFQMPFQILRLEQHPGGLERWPRQGHRTSSETSNILHLRPWTRLTFNEGSSVSAYGTYEYFHLVAPSWLNAIEYGMPMLETTPALRSFTYVATFPFSRMDPLCCFVRSLRLRELRIQLTPMGSCEGHMLNGKSSMDVGRADIRDLWMEYETSCHNLALLLPLPNDLERLEIVDAQTSEYVRSVLDRTLTQKIPKEWRYCGSGIWLKERIADKG